MNKCLENVTNYLKPYLLSNIIIRTDKKVLRKGKFKIFQVKQHYIRFMLEIAGNTKMYEMPYPFDIHETESSTILSYKLSAFMKDSDIILQSKLLDTSQKSKLYDSFVYILTSG